MVGTRIGEVVTVVLAVANLIPLSTGTSVRPSQCFWAQENARECHVDAITDHFGTWLTEQTWPLSNSTMPLPGYRDVGQVRMLSIACRGSNNSKISSTMFTKLNKLNRLEAHNCNLRVFYGDFGTVLPELRFLNLTGDPESNNSSEVLRLENISLPIHLETIDLSFLSIHSIPDDLFCELHSLLVLNLSSNKLHDMEQLGFTSTNGSVYPKASLLNASIRRDSKHSPVHQLDSSKEGDCISSMQSLVLNNNTFTNIPESSFRFFRELKDLSIAGNKIQFISEQAFKGLSSLRTLDLSDNHINYLQNETFQGNTNLQKILLSKNSLTTLSPKIFRGLKELQILDLSQNNLTLNDAKIFVGLRRLVILNLSGNFLRFIDPLLFQDLSALQILNLSNTGIEGLQLGTFSNMYNLYELDLSNNKISTVSRESFSGLAGLNTLNLHNNSLSRIEDQVLEQSANLKTIILSHNHFEEIPRSLENLSFLKHIDMNYNKLMSIEPFSFKGLRSLHHLHLSGNIISNLTEDSFADLSSLRVLNLADNNLASVAENSLRSIKDLETLDLSRNQLGAMAGLFAAMEKLEVLRLQENHISQFDYSFLPRQLLILNLSRNRIRQLGNYFKVHNFLALQELDVSFNKLVSLSEVSLPNSIKIINLEENYIKEIKPGTLREKVNVEKINLRLNQIRKLNPNSISPKLTSSTRDQSTVFLGGNPLLCDCDMEWLHVASSSKNYSDDSYGADYVLPVIGDPSDVLCTLPHSHQNITRYSKVVDTSPEDFLCSYTQHCFALCHCCDFIACDCRMRCPDSCSCFHDDTWKINLVDCSRGSLDKLPDTVPMDATVVLLDGNDLKVLHAHQFIGRHSIEKLYLNQSNIQILQNRTFHGLAALKELHLQDNMIVKLNGFEFFGLSHLKKLYLQNNRISFLSNSTFRALTTLEILRIDNNYIINFPVWMLDHNKLLQGLTLFNNPWDCGCTFVEKLKLWATSQQKLIPRSSELFCVKSDDVIESISSPDFVCTQSDEAVSHYQLGAYELHLLAGCLCGFALLITILIVVAMYLARKRASKGHKLGYSSSSYPKDEESRVFDAFICYNLQDISFIRDLTDKLERESPSYKLCLIHRDKADSLTMMDFIAQSICFSKRIIVLLSRKFIENEWQNPLFQRTVIDNIKNRENSVVFIDLEITQGFEVDADFKKLLKISYHIKWTDKKLWKRLEDFLPSKSMYGGFPAFITDPSYKSPIPFMDRKHANELPSSSSVLTATTGLPTPSEPGRNSLLQDCPLPYKSQVKTVSSHSPSDYIYMNHRESSRVPYDFHGTSRDHYDGDSSSVHTYNSLEILANQRSSAYGDGTSSPENHQYSLITPPKYYASKGTLCNGAIRPNNFTYRTSPTSDSGDIYEQEVSFHPYGPFQRPNRFNSEVTSSSISSSTSSYKQDEMDPNPPSLLKPEECFV